MKIFGINIGLWLFILSALITVNELTKHLTSKQCHAAQLNATVIMFLMFSFNMVISSIVNICTSCNNGIIKFLYMACASYIPPFYILISGIMILLEERECGLFDLKDKAETFPFRFLMFILVCLNTLAPFWYNIDYIQNTNINNYIQMTD